MEDPKIILTDADGLANSPDERAFIILHITRQEIEACNIASALDRLSVLTDTLENVLRYRESVAIQVSGYDEDDRELSEIQEVRKYFRALVDQWPHWPWYLHRKIGAIALLMALLCRIEIFRDPYRTHFLDMDEVKNVFADLFERGNALFRMYKISTEDVLDSTKSAVEELVAPH